MLSLSLLCAVRHCLLDRNLVCPLWVFQDPEMIVEGPMTPLEVCPVMDLSVVACYPLRRPMTLAAVVEKVQWLRRALPERSFAHHFACLEIYSRDARETVGVAEQRLIRRWHFQK